MTKYKISNTNESGWEIERLNGNPFIQHNKWWICIINTEIGRYYKEKSSDAEMFVYRGDGLMELMRATMFFHYLNKRQCRGFISQC